MAENRSRDGMTVAEYSLSGADRVMFFRFPEPRL
jgi:hypothetical protein